MSNSTSYRDVGRPTIISVQERYPGAVPRSDLSTRVDRRCPPAMTPNEEYDAIRAGAQPRGSIDRPHRTQADADRGIARQAAQDAAAQAIDPEAFHALKVELEAQRELATRQAAQIQQLLERLDALDGSQPEEAA
jgi:hypothetical protein